MAKQRAEDPTVLPREPGAAPKPDQKFTPKQVTFWTMFFNLGAFLAGAAAGYFFSKAEEKFTSFGEEMAWNMIKSLRKGKGEVRGEGESRFRPTIVPGRDRFERTEFGSMGDRPPFGEPGEDI